MERGKGRTTLLRLGLDFVLVALTVLLSAFILGSPATGYRCDVFLNGRNVFLSGASYDQVDATAGRVVSLFGALVPRKCRAAALQLVCQSYFPACQITATGLSVLTVVVAGTVITPCRSVCEAVLLECLPLLASVNATSLAPDCDLTQSVGGVLYPVYPPDGVVPCFPYSSATEVAYSQVDCPYPTNYDSDRFNPEKPQDACVYQCPVYAFGGEEEYNAVVAAMYTTTVPSMLCGFVMTLTWLLNPAKRRYPAILIMWLSISAFAVAFFANLSVLMGGPRRTTCTKDEAPTAVTMDNASENNGQGVVCIMQAIGTYYFGLTCNFWWLAININIFLMLCFSKHEWVRRWSRYIHYGFHVFCWGVPLAGLITMLSMKKLGADGINPFCQVRYQDKDESWVDWVFYTSPIMFCLFVGTILMIISVTRFTIVRQAAFALLQPTSLKLQFMFYVAYRIYVEDMYNTVTNSLVYCSFLTGSECDYDPVLNYPFYLVTLMASLSTGVCIFLTMCTTRSTLVLWWRLLKGLRHPRSFIAHTRLIVSSHGSSSSSSTMDSPSAGTEMSATPPSSLQSAGGL
ncbi:Frizzled/Smoothened family membrane region protein [Acanthamoeba castellanii str. Neff]|uniref:Frizzled/Smoothened family membrane region protein n=1 Tax=Acanthamoeba castellanii (strain ATCC 30010 / Neff) TaxID=1257118 RepID=L8HH45_ACACF|nr:Frizzled/Smoothened family membrane region protein [Acanthamoeba castellanii str. Neff]ELR24894.1 Frizzled/Smoothened family membrane region protein [Acanthamoeba castellanii str. Neff]